MPRTTHLTRDDAWTLLTRYNRDPFHLRHAETVEKTMRHFARELGFADEEDYWGIVGLLHDIDFELWPSEHCIKSQTLLREHGVDESVNRAVASHGWGICTDIAPEHPMEKSSTPPTNSPAFWVRSSSCTPPRAPATSTSRA